MVFTFDIHDSAKNQIKKLNKEEQLKLFFFLRLFEEKGFNGINRCKIDEYCKKFKIKNPQKLKGKIRNKNSGNVSKNDPEYSEKMEYVQKEKLWHYHLGYKKDTTSVVGGYRYSKRKDFTSDSVVHYEKTSLNHIVIRSLGTHSPFKLPGY